MLNDAEADADVIPYLGKEGDPPALNLGVQAVQKLVEPLKGSNPNITCNRHFTSVSLTEDLHKDNFTAVGTAMPNKKRLPLALIGKQAKVREIGSSMFAFKGSLTMVLWHSKHSKHVLLFLPLNQNATITEKCKPEIVEFYNETKAGVDALDQNVRHYSIYRKTYVFYNIFGYICLQCTCFIPDATSSC